VKEGEKERETETKREREREREREGERERERERGRKREREKKKKLDELGSEDSSKVEILGVCVCIYACVRVCVRVRVCACVCVRALLYVSIIHICTYADKKTKLSEFGGEDSRKADRNSQKSSP